MPPSILPQILSTRERDILEEWVKEELAMPARSSGDLNEAEVRDESRRLLGLLRQATETGQLADIQAAEWEPVREFLADVSRSRARQGYTPSETASFVLSLKRPLFTYLRREAGRDAEVLGHEVWTVSLLLDRLALYTTEVFQKNREEIILRQRQEMLELSTPVVELWQGVLALPLIGTLDSERTQVVMETLLRRIVESRAAIAIIDITGVPTVDTLVAQHLLKTVAAARLMGADCVISGIRPQIAQTIIHLGIDLGNVTTKASLAGALAYALQRTGLTITRVGPGA